MKKIIRIASVMLVIIIATCIAGCKNKKGTLVPMSITQSTTTASTTLESTTLESTTLESTTSESTAVQLSTVAIAMETDTTSEIEELYDNSDSEIVYSETPTTEPTTIANEEFKEHDEENDDSYSEDKSYVEVNISTQTLNYYENGVVVLSSPVVTGADDTTPTGEFYIVNKAQDIILYGDDYETPVEYWIAFLGSSYGFHDASWRSEFGYDIYTYDGSHGCVNMPLEAVAELYDLVEIGMPVFIE